MAGNEKSVLNKNAYALRLCIAAALGNAVSDVMGIG
jgi:hypothetical protein